MNEYKTSQYMLLVLAQLRVAAIPSSMSMFNLIVDEYFWSSDSQLSLEYGHILISGTHLLTY